MEIITRYNAGDRVFFLDDQGHIADSTIRTVMVEQTIGDDNQEHIEIVYQLAAWKTPGGRGRYRKHEHELNSTIEDLLKRLEVEYKSKNNGQI